MTDVDDVAEFARWHVSSGDIDPAYPVLRDIAAALALDDEQRLRLALLYVAVYDLPSALTVWGETGWPTHGVPDGMAVATGVERRANRDRSRLLAHLAAVTARLDGHGSAVGWLRPAVTDDPVESWVAVSNRLRGVYGNGRWAAYKTCEVLARVCGFPLAAPDADHASSTGPRQGLGLLVPGVAALTGNDPATIRLLDRITDKLRVAVSTALGFGLPVEQFETVLCDWHSMVDGRYYVGHDIDQMLGQASRAAPHVRDLILDARRSSFDARWLGEVGGWDGVRRPLLPLWRDSRRLDWWT